jgi:hypothetical protein
MVGASRVSLRARATRLSCGARKATPSLASLLGRLIVTASRLRSWGSRRDRVASRNRGNGAGSSEHRTAWEEHFPAVRLPAHQGGGARSGARRTFARARLGGRLAGWVSVSWRAGSSCSPCSRRCSCRARAPARRRCGSAGLPRFGLRRSRRGPARSGRKSESLRRIGCS